MDQEKLQALFEGLPFRNIPIGFHDYWRAVAAGTQPAEPLLSFKNGGLHELAHVICVEDPLVLDPYYGAPMEDVDAEVSMEVLLGSELEVFYVTVQLELWVGAASPEAMFFLWHAGYGPGCKRLPEPQAKRIYKSFWDKWGPPGDCTQILAELQRKRAVVAQAVMAL